MPRLSGSIRTTKLPSGEPVPVLGQGTWHMAEHPARRKDEIAALRLAVDLGLAVIDTAEMYADGATEELVGEALDGRRDEIFLVSKVMPHNATHRGTVAACERSLRRLRTDHLDLYLLHWRGAVPLDATLAGFEVLMSAGKIRHWGVSNFDLSDMEELVSLPGGVDVTTDQVLYNLTRRGIEYDLLPWCLGRGIPVMAYSPIEQGRMLEHFELKQVAARHGATPAQVAIAWVLRISGIITTPKAGTPEHVRENRGALDLHLTPQDFAELDRVFPPPTEPRPLEII